MRIIEESEFDDQFRFKLRDTVGIDEVGFVTGPGRSGAIAAVYASHILGIPYVPYKCFAKGRALIVDTARESGATMRKAMRYYKEYNPVECVAFEEPPRVAFWYEAGKPQRYRHEIRA